MKVYIDIHWSDFLVFIISECHRKCKSCNGPNHNQCTSCTNSAQVVFLGECLNNCPDNFFIRGGNCIGKIYHNHNQCTSCTNSAQVVFLGECLNNCPDNFFIQGGNCIGKILSLLMDPTITSVLPVLTQLRLCSWENVSIIVLITSLSEVETVLVRFITTITSVPPVLTQLRLCSWENVSIIVLITSLSREETVLVRFYHC